MQAWAKYYEPPTAAKGRRAVRTRPLNNPNKNRNKLAAPRLAFIHPLSPSAAVRPPKGDDWLHEPKWDGYRFQIIKDGSQVRFYSRHGAEYTDRLPGMVEALAKLPTQPAILDGELVLIDPRRRLADIRAAG
jgi:ATP-dependent DNA ligase